MSFAALRRHVLALPGVQAEIKWQVDWVASIGRRMFFVGGPEPGPWKAVSFKVDDHRFLELTGVPGVVPAPYLARARWVQVTEPKALPLGELKSLVTRSHALVAARLTRKQRQDLGASP